MSKTCMSVATTIKLHPARMCMPGETRLAREVGGLMIFLAPKSKNLVRGPPVTAAAGDRGDVRTWLVLCSFERLESRTVSRGRFQTFRSARDAGVLHD